MIRIAALNDSSSGSSDGSSGTQLSKTNPTKEAIENAAYALYNKGLSCDRAGLAEKAIKSYEDLLQSEFITKSATLGDDGRLHQSAILKYSALKNLAKCYSRQGRNQEAIEALLQAIEIDFTDVSVCYMLGILARKMDHVMLACRAFEKGLELSPQHWLSLDNLITLLYAINNYEASLCYIAEALVLDAGYVKGLVLRKSICKEQPFLETEYSSVFSKCNMEEILFYTQHLESEDECEILDEVKLIRDIQRERCRPRPQPSVALDLQQLSWAALGKRLLELYTHIEDKSPELDHSCPLVMNIKQESLHRSTACSTDNETLTALPEIIVTNDVTVHTADIDVPPLRLAQFTDSDNSQCAASTSTSDSDRTSGEGNFRAQLRADVVKPAQFTDTEDNDSVCSLGASQEAHVRAVIKDMLAQLDDDREVVSAGKVISDEEMVDQVLADIVQQVSVNMDMDLNAEVRVTIKQLVDKIVEETDRTDLSQRARPSGSDHIYACARQSGSDHMYAKPSGSASDLEPAKTIGSHKKPIVATLASERKRRSARVKLTTTKHNTSETVKGDKVSHVSELEGIVPSCLLNEATAEHGYYKLGSTADDMVVDDRPIRGVATSPQSLHPSFSDEEEDVRLFLSRLQTNDGVVSVMRQWLYTLVDKRTCSWPAELRAVYTDVYQVHRPCYQMPNIFTVDNVEKDALPSLLWMELKLELVASSHRKAEGLGDIFIREFTYWEMVVGNSGKLPSICSEFSLRYYYMAAQYYVAIGQPGDAVNVYRNLMEYMDSLTGDTASPVSVSVVNSKQQPLISPEKVAEELALLERAQSLDELQTVYDADDHSMVIELLSPTFSVELEKRFSTSRYTQLSLLLDTVDKMADLDACMRWLANALQESVYHSDNGYEGSWVELISRALELSNAKLTGESIKHCPLSCKVKIVKGCLSVLRVNTAALEDEKKTPVSSVLPWILLSKLTKADESSTTSDSPTADLPMSIQMLVKAHTYLASQSLCTMSEGLLLQQLMEMLLDYLGSGQCSSRQQAEQHFNQCVYCLYGHPTKKIRAKNLSDHGSRTIAMTWPAAQQLFDYYKPKSVPEFDSYKSSTISAELEHLLKRIVLIVPPECQPDPVTVDTVDSYLSENSKVADLDGLSVPRRSGAQAECYYLLADYYFKNKEPLKAIKHYVQDLYYSPDRLDSWAGMALAKSSKLESRLGLMERQCYDGAFQKLAVSTLQSFVRALQLNHDNVKLWIEYACSTYQLHSFASRVMKTRKSDLSPLDLATFTKLKTGMLTKSKYCYMEASHCKDEDFEEEWLHHYMLGKISEKSQEAPASYLHHYVKAAQCLAEVGAQYPAKISYMYNPPYLAVEALEMYYRIHASILKCVQRTDSDQHYELYTKVIFGQKKSPFATAQFSSPQTPASRKRRTASELVEKFPLLKRRKSETEIVVPVPIATITTRRQEKLRLDAEVINEVMEEMLCEVSATKPSKTCINISFDTEGSGEDMKRSVKGAPHVMKHSVEGAPHVMKHSVEGTPHDMKHSVEGAPHVMNHSVEGAPHVMKCDTEISGMSTPKHAEYPDIDLDSLIIRDVRILMNDVLKGVNGELPETSAVIGNISSAIMSSEEDSIPSRISSSSSGSDGAQSDTALLSAEGGGAIVVLSSSRKRGRADDLSEAEGRDVDRSTSSSDIEEVALQCVSDLLDGVEQMTGSSSLAARTQAASTIGSEHELADAVPSAAITDDVKMDTVVDTATSSDVAASAMSEDDDTDFITTSDVDTKNVNESSHSKPLVMESVVNVVPATPAIPMAICTATEPLATPSTTVASTTLAGDVPIAATANAATTADNEMSNATICAETTPSTSIAADVSGFVSADSEAVATASELTVSTAEYVTAMSPNSVSSAAEDIATIIESVATTESVATIMDSIATTTESIATSTESVTTTADSVATTTKSVSTTADSVATTTESIATTTDSKATTTESKAMTAESLESERMATNTQFVVRTTEFVTTPAPRMDTPTESVVTAAQSITRTTESIVTTVQPTATSTTDSIVLTTESITTSAQSITVTTGFIAAPTQLLATATESIVRPTNTVSKPSVLKAFTFTVLSQPHTLTMTKDGLIEACLTSLKLCVQRYPLHYKSYFRLAKVYLHDKQRKDLDKVQDLLLGNTAKRKEDKFVSQGLFQDRKHNNFFNGVWRIPVEEIERAGSFGAHLYKTIYLLLQFLHEKRDYHLLYQLHTQLHRTPEQEKKFLKDADRLQLSSKSMEFAIHSLYKTIGTDTPSKGEYNYAASLHQAYKWHTYCNKSNICVPNAQVLLVKAYKSYKMAVDKNFQADIKTVATEAKEFCQQMFSGRSKDKTKAADSKQSGGSKQTADSEGSKLLVVPIASARPGKDVQPLALPPVRGSFQSFDGEKAKKTRVMTTSAAAAEVPGMSSLHVDGENKPAAKPNIPADSWLNKAKEGTAVLASMFAKPKSTL